MRDTQLFVIGDSHANFWNGSGNHGGYDAVPGIRSQTIPGALAYSLIRDDSETDARGLTLASVHTAVAEGFEGWIMLYFGANDCNGWIWRQVLHMTLEASVRTVVERYVKFILEVREIYPKIAIFAPPATTKSPLFLGDVGTEPERNLAILLFTSMLEAVLAPEQIQVISMAKAMIGPDGRTRGELFWDCNHASQAMMPYALSLTNKALGLQLQWHDDPVFVRAYRVRSFASVDYCDLFEKRWLRLVLPEGGQYISEIALWPATFAELERIDIVTSLDRHTYIGLSHEFSDAVEAPAQRRYLPVEQHARNILISSPVREIRRDEIDIFKLGSQISESATYSSDSLFAIHDRIMQRDAKRVITAEFRVPSKAVPAGEMRTVTP